MTARAFVGPSTLTVPANILSMLLRVFVFAVVLSTIVPLKVLAAPDFPELTGRIVDRANLLDTGTKTALDTQLAEQEATTSNQIVVATVPSLQGYNISEFANQLGRHWAIGQANKDNGVLLLVAPNERKVRIEVGYGLEGALTDAISADIIRRQILPLFREGNYVNGIRNGINSITSAIDGEYTAEPLSASGKSDNILKSHFPLFFIALIVGFELLKRFGRRFGMHKLGNSGFPTAIFGIAVTAITGNIIFGIIASIIVFLLSVFFTKPGRAGGTGAAPYHHESDNRNSSYGSGGSGFGGGGGSFGGGGASGGW